MGRPNIKIWVLTILLNAIWAQDASTGYRLESIEPNIIRNGDWINLYVSTRESALEKRIAIPSMKIISIIHYCNQSKVNTAAKYSYISVLCRSDT